VYNIIHAYACVYTSIITITDPTLSKVHYYIDFIEYIDSDLLYNIYALHDVI